MKYFLRIIVFLFLFLPKNACAISWFTDYKLSKAYQQKDYKKVRDVLEKEQVDSPNDAQLNYNLGTAYYKLNQIERAKDSFDRCIKNCSKDQKDLKEFSHFNLGNCLYKSCLQILPTGWEKMETIEDQKLNPAISQAQGAVENYKNVLTLNEKNNKAKVNQKKAQELLEKLLKKRKQQQNQQQQNQQQQDKQKQEQQKQNQSEDQKSQDGSEQKQEQKDSAKKDDDNKKNQQQQQKGQDGAQERADNFNDGAYDKFQDKQETQKDKSVSQESTHDKDSQKKEQQIAQPEENGTKEEQEKQTKASFGQEGQEDGLKERGFRVILDDLQSDESKMQKMVIKQKSKGQEKRLDSKQKPW